MSTKEQPGPFDGLERAEPGEPVFTLRAHDVSAPALVAEWVRLRREAINSGNMSEEKRELELIQCREAEEIGWSMIDWRSGVQAVAAPEVKEGETPKYSGHQSSEEELAAKKRYDVIKAAVATLNNALSEAVDAASSLAEYGFGSERAVILAAADRLKAVSDHIAPKRASYAIGETEPAPFGSPTVCAVFPKTIGRLHLGERRSDGGRLCNWNHDVPVGHPLYWPEQISQYDDSDPCCIEHAIEQYVSEAGYTKRAR